MILIAFLIIAETAHAGFKMYTPGQKEPAMSIQESQKAEKVQSFQRDGGLLIELSPGAYSLVLTQDLGNESFANLIDNKGRIFAQVTLDKKSSTGGKTVYINQKAWYTVKAGGSESANAKIYPGHFTTQNIKNSPQVTYEGTGKRIIGPFELREGYYSISYTHKGESNFVVRVIANGKLKDIVVNEIGFAYGEVGLIMDESANCFFEIDADGKWHIMASPR